MGEPVGVQDVAQYILDTLGDVTTKKLQKLCYYAQAWSLVWDDAPLFGDRIEAWVEGPVVPTLYDVHRGRYQVRNILEGDPGRLSEEQRYTVDAILREYGKIAPDKLVERTHIEAPWRDARQGKNLPPNQPGHVEITHDSMAEFYGLYGDLDPDKGRQVKPAVEAMLLRSLETPSENLLSFG